MKGILNFRIVILLLVLGVIYFFLCDFKTPLKNIGKDVEFVARVDSVKTFQLFEMYTYEQVYYHYFVEREPFNDSITSNRLNGTVNRGDSLIIIVSNVNPVRHHVKSLHGRKQEAYQHMGW